MLDLGAARTALEAAKAGDHKNVPISPAWLEQAIAEIEAGRAAQERLGQTFGLKGQKL